MPVNTQETGDGLEPRARVLLQDSVEGLDFAMRSRLTQARQAALQRVAAEAGGRFLRLPFWKPAAGVAAAVLLGVALWSGRLSGTLSGTPAMTGDSQTNLEDLDIVAASDPGAGDAIEMLQDDIDFYDFADRAASAEPAA